MNAIGRRRSTPKVLNREVFGNEFAAQLLQIKCGPSDLVLTFVHVALVVRLGVVIALTFSISLMARSSLTLTNAKSTIFRLQELGIRL